MTLDNEACPPGVPFGIALVSLALMHTQIVLTRLFSVVVWYHFAFFAISVALLGLSASALCVHALPRRAWNQRTPRLLAISALVLSASILGLSFMVLRVTPDWFGAGQATFFTIITLKLIVVFCGTSAPFFFGGFAISLAVSRWPSAIHRIYAWDLVGAAFACALVIPVLDQLGGPKALLVSSGFAALSAVVFGGATSQPVRRQSLLRWALLSGVLLGLGVAGASAAGLEIRVAKGLDLKRSAPEYNRWNSFSLVSVFPSWKFRGWGLSPKYADPIPPEKSVVIDMNAFTPMLAFNGDFNTVRHTRFDLSALAYRLGALNKVCVIGAGGGKDVLAALAAGAKRVTAVEVNPLIANDIMRHHYVAFTGGLYNRRDVDLHVEDGRSFIRSSSPEKFDVILISMVDTSAATAAGAYALAENSLYTVDAFRDFISKLSPHGILTVSSVSLPGLAVGARLAALARAALREQGRDPAHSVAVVDTQWLALAGATMHNVLIKPDGFSKEDESALSRVSDDLGFKIAYLPSVAATPGATSEASWISRTLREPSDSILASERDTWPLDVSPVYDNRPYFFFQNRLRDSWQALHSSGESHLFGNGLVVLLKVLVTSVLTVALCILAPLAWLMFRSRKEGRSGNHLGVDLLYVGCLGLGYMFVEIGCIQRLLLYLGTPTYALTAVLLVLLLSGGIGSRSAAKGHSDRVQSLLILLVVYILFWTLAWPTIATLTVSFPLGVRVVVAGSMMVPLGFLMGIPLPSGLSAAYAKSRDRMAWLWAVNGATSVLGSVLATLGSMNFGVTQILLTGVALYALVAALWRKLAYEKIALESADQPS